MYYRNDPSKYSLNFTTFAQGNVPGSCRCACGLQMNAN